MKKFSILLFAFLAVATWSCSEDDEELFIDQPQGELIITSSAAGSYILTFDTKDNLAERLTWTPINFSTPISVSYTLLKQAMDPSNFEDATLLRLQTKQVQIYLLSNLMS